MERMDDHGMYVQDASGKWVNVGSPFFSPPTAPPGAAPDPNLLVISYSIAGKAEAWFLAQRQRIVAPPDGELRERLTDEFGTS